MNKPNTDPVQELNRLVSDGISTDIYLAHEAHSIFRAIGERVPSANASTYQHIAEADAAEEEFRAAEAEVDRITQEIRAGKR
jgi:hypothetical protein